MRTAVKCNGQNLTNIQIKFGLVGCIEDLRRFSGISVISRLGSRRKPISEIQVARRGIEPHNSCSASQELNQSATTAPTNEVIFHIPYHNNQLQVYNFIVHSTYTLYWAFGFCLTSVTGNDSHTPPWCQLDFY